MTRIRVECASRPEVATFDGRFNRINHDEALHADREHLGEGLNDGRIHRIIAPDLVGLEHLVLHADRIARRHHFPRRAILRRESSRAERIGRHVTGLGGDKIAVASAVDVHERRHVLGDIARRIGVRDILRHRRLPHRKPVLLRRREIKKINRFQGRIRLLSPGKFTARNLAPGWRARLFRKALDASFASAMAATSRRVSAAAPCDPVAKLISRNLHAGMCGPQGQIEAHQQLP